MFGNESKMQNRNSLLFVSLTKGLTCLLLAASLLSCTEAQAGVMTYNFVEDGTNEILATLTLNMTPNPPFGDYVDSIENFELLSFTEAGRVAFGSTDPIEDYMGINELGYSSAENRFESFDGDLIYERDMQLYADGSAEIRGETRDGNGDYATNLVLVFTGEFATELSSLSYNIEDDITKYGRWELSSVPEPASFTLWGCFAAIGMGGSLRRRRRKS